MIAVLNLGRCDYATSLRLQQTLVELRQQGRVPDVLLFVEHPPVITLGRNARQTNIVASAEWLQAHGVEVHEINRGGDVTFHGPGQLVAYPIFDLRSFSPRLGAVGYVRLLEEVLMRVCAHYGVETQRICGLTGVWTYAEAPPNGAPGGTERKIAAIGVHIARGVTSHGFALNVTTDLEFFRLIVPCGLSRPVTSIEFETGLKPTLDEVAVCASRSFGACFAQQMLWLESLEDLLCGAAAQEGDGARKAEGGAKPSPCDTPARAPENERRIAGDDLHLA
jgi:lipoyl(octanoyl) transferase